MRCSSRTCLTFQPHSAMANLLNRYSAEVIEQRKVGFREYLELVVSLLAERSPSMVLRDFLNLPPPDETSQHGAANVMDDQMIASTLEATDTVILVAYQLPLLVTRSAEEGGGFDVMWDDNSVLNKQALNLKCRVFWVGCVSLAVEKEEEEELAELLWERYDCVVVFLEPTLQSKFYHGFCRGYLRPIFHNQLVLPTEKDPYSDEDWRPTARSTRSLPRR